MYKAEEDYIKYIYEKSLKQGQVTIKDVAIKFNYTEQSVYEMIKKLQQKDVLTYIPYQGIQLSQLGNEEAIRMIRAHRIWEVFLKEYLDYDWHEVNEEAEMLEHAGSEAMLERLYKKLGEPKYCQHGNPIPNFNNTVNIDDLLTLESFLEGEYFSLLRVSDDKALLLFLKEKHIEMKDSLFIDKKYENHGLIEVVNKFKESVTLTYHMANMMYGKISQ
jgi:DtxR family Mn-dependent transcriptional regulator